MFGVVQWWEIATGFELRIRYANYGICAGLSALGIRRLSEKTGKTAKVKRIARLTREYKEALYFSLHLQFLIYTLLLRCMGIMVYGVYLILLVQMEVTRTVRREFLAFVSAPLKQCCGRPKCLAASELLARSSGLMKTNYNRFE